MLPIFLYGNSMGTKMLEIQEETRKMFFEAWKFYLSGRKP